jgi:hypothetical protein
MPIDFPVFPAGVRGVALLLQRVAAAILLVLTSSLWCEKSLWPIFPVLTLAACLAAGFLTRLMVAICIFLTLCLALRLGGLAGTLLALNALQFVALGLVGAGAYSVDAWLFGRREIRLTA